MFEKKSKYERDKDLIEFNSRLLDQRQKDIAEIAENNRAIQKLQDQLAFERAERMKDDRLLNESFNEKINLRNNLSICMDALDDTQRRAGGIVGKATQTNNKMELQPE